MNAVIYARLASHYQPETMEAQLEACRAYARQCGLAVVEEYIDPEANGYSDPRPALQRLLRDAEKMSFSRVVVHKFSRLARRPADLRRCSDYLKQFGVDVVSVVEGPEIPLFPFL